MKDGFSQAVKDNGPGALAAMVSPMLSCEEAYLLGKFVRAIDPQALLAVGPVPVDGEDKTFPGGYTVYAEKCPNKRGVRRALELLGGEVLNFEELSEKLADKKGPIGGVLLTGNYPSQWATPELTKALGKRFVVLIDTLESTLGAKAKVVLPGLTWAEKDGTFENVEGRLQSFEAAVGPVEFARSEGQIAMDLLVSLGQRERAVFDAATIRSEMGGVFVDDVHEPGEAVVPDYDLQYVEL